jgi:hypothetical protein
MLHHVLFCLLLAALVGGPAHDALGQSASTLTLAAQDDWAAAPTDSSTTIHVLSNDYSSPAPLDPSTLTITSHPLYGEVSVNTRTGGVTYTPDEGYSGEDAFAYTVANTDGETTNVATVAVVVTGNEPPYIDEFYAYQDSGLVWVLTGHVIDEYPGLCTIQIGGVWTDSIEVEADGTFEYARVLHGPGGIVTVQATDLYGLTSNICQYEIGGF